MNKNSPDNLQTVDRIIVPTLVFAVEYIVKIEPCTELLIDLKFSTSTNVCSTF